MRTWRSGTTLIEFTQRELHIISDFLEHKADEDTLHELYDDDENEDRLLTIRELRVNFITMRNR